MYVINLFLQITIIHTKKYVLSQYTVINQVMQSRQSRL